ncbi:transposase [Streptomyces sp. NPDC056656]|uniref:transposase n=1 Tax=Streptomyces sp. NPDC056656 TaxID=3345895 RepID=UPI0036B24DBD
MPRASRSPSPCPARTRTTASSSSRSSAAYPPSGPAGDHDGADVKLRSDKAYFSAEHLARLRERELVARIARPGIESGERLGRHRWKIERSIAWLFGYRRPTVRYERKGSHFLAFLGLAAALTRYKKLAKPAT